MIICPKIRCIRKILAKLSCIIMNNRICKLIVNLVHVNKLPTAISSIHKRHRLSKFRYTLCEICIFNTTLFYEHILECFDGFKNQFIDVVKDYSFIEVLFYFVVCEFCFAREDKEIFGGFAAPVVAVSVSFSGVVVDWVYAWPMNSFWEVFLNVSTELDSGKNCWFSNIQQIFDIKWVNNTFISYLILNFNLHKLNKIGHINLRIM